MVRKPEWRWGRVVVLEALGGSMGLGKAFGLLLVEVGQPWKGGEP